MPETIEETLSQCHELLADKLELRISELHRLATEHFDSGRLKLARECMSEAAKLQAERSPERVMAMEVSKGLA